MHLEYIYPSLASKTTLGVEKTFSTSIEASHDPIEIDYNEFRSHSSIDYLLPMEFRRTLLND